MRTDTHHICTPAQTRTEYHSAVKFAAIPRYLWRLAEGNSSSSHLKTRKEVVSQLPGRPLARLRGDTSQKSLPTLTLKWRQQQQILRFSILSALGQNITIPQNYCFTSIEGGLLTGR